MRNLSIDAHHCRPSMTWNRASATRMKESERVKIHSHLVREFISNSSRPVLDLEGDVESA